MTVTYRHFSADSHLEIDSKWWLPRVLAAGPYFWRTIRSA